MLRISSGSSFQSFVATTLKERSPNDRKDFSFGYSNIILSLDRKEYLPFFLMLNKSAIYFRAIPYKTLKVTNKSLKLILNLTGNQCSSYKIGVKWQYLRVEVTSLAAAFCTLQFD